MGHVYQLSDAQVSRASIVTIGVFDGLHIGHQALLKRLVAEARATNRDAVALTFFPHPDAVLKGLEGRYYLTTPQQRAELMMSLGIDWVVTHPFNESVRHIRAADFVDQLSRYLKLSALWVGADFAMGYKREGDIHFLQAQGREKGFTVHTLDLIFNADEGAVISSSKIRERIQEGAVDGVREWLGRSYSVSGKVIKGDQRGRQLGFPTANIAVWEGYVLPSNGVYAGWALLGAERFMAVTNIGIRPTFGGENITVEAHLLDFDRDIYGEELTITFESRLRSEQKFAGIADLKAQIHADIASARATLMTLYTSVD